MSIQQENERATSVTPEAREVALASIEGGLRKTSRRLFHVYAILTGQESKSVSLLELEALVEAARHYRYLADVMKRRSERGP